MEHVTMEGTCPFEDRLATGTTLVRCLTEHCVSDCEDELRPPRCAFAHNILKGDCCGCWRQLKEKLRPFVTSWLFDLGIILFIILNIIFMATEHYPMMEETYDLLSNTNLVSHEDEYRCLDRFSSHGDVILRQI